MPTELVSAPYNFTSSELRELSIKLTAELDKKKQIEGRKKTIMSDLKSEAETNESAIQDLSSKVSSGREHREYMCEIILDFEAREKRFVRREDGEILKVAPLTQQDWQSRLLPVDEEEFDGVMQ